MGRVVETRCEPCSALGGKASFGVGHPMRLPRNPWKAVSTNEVEWQEGGHCVTPGQQVCKERRGGESKAAGCLWGWLLCRWSISFWCDGALHPGIKGWEVHSACPRLTRTGISRCACCTFRLSLCSHLKSFIPDKIKWQFQWRKPFRKEGAS